MYFLNQLVYPRCTPGVPGGVPPVYPRCTPVYPRCTPGVYRVYSWYVYPQYTLVYPGIPRYAPKYTPSIPPVYTDAPTFSNIYSIVTYSHLCYKNDTVYAGELNKWQGIRQKILKISNAERKGFKFYGKGPSPDYSEYEEVYIFYTENFGVGNQSDTQTFFYKLHKSRYGNDKKTLFCIFDTSLMNSNMEAKPGTIAHYKQGKKVSNNVVDEYGSGSLIEFPENGLFCSKVPINRALVELKCPAFYSKEALCTGKKIFQILGIPKVF